jgi:exonuclease VII large subunit
VLERGYSITVNQRTGKVVTAAADVNPGDVIQTELARQNTIESVVQKTQSA